MKTKVAVAAAALSALAWVGMAHAQGPGAPPLNLPKGSPLSKPEFAEAGRD